MECAIFDDEQAQKCITTYTNKSVQVGNDDDSIDDRLELNNLVIGGAPLVSMMVPRLMASGDGNCDNQKMFDVNFKLVI